MTERKDDTGLEAFFAAGRTAAPQVSDAFVSRMTELALDQQVVQAQRMARAPRVQGLWPALRQALGGWPGLAGLAAACATGLWLGVSPPQGVTDLWSGQSAGLGELGVDPVSGYDLAMLEG